MPAADGDLPVPTQRSNRFHTAWDPEEPLLYALRGHWRARALRRGLARARRRSPRDERRRAVLAKPRRSALRHLARRRGVGSWEL